MRPKVRWRVLERDHHTCQYCGASAPDVVLEVDHVVPKSRGGSDHPSNLVTSCWSCNRGKKARDATESFVARSVCHTLRTDTDTMFAWNNDLRAERDYLEARIDALEEEVRYLRYQLEWRDEPSHPVTHIGDVMRGMAS